MKNQTYYIQIFLANKLDQYKGKGNLYANNHIKEIQEAYQIEHQETK